MGDGAPYSSPGSATRVLVMLTFSAGEAGEAEGPKLTLGKGVTPRLTWLKLFLCAILARFLLSKASPLTPGARTTSGILLLAVAILLTSRRAAWMVGPYVDSRSGRFFVLVGGEGSDILRLRASNDDRRSLFVMLSLRSLRPTPLRRQPS